MGKVELDVPPDVDRKIARLVSEDEFENEKRAAEQLLRMGLQAFETGNTIEDDEELYNRISNNSEDEYVF